MISVRALNITETIGFLSFQKLLSCVSNETRKRVKRIRLIEDCKRTLYGEAFVRCLAMRALNIPNNRIIISRNHWGKPALLEFPYFNFNISHAGDWIVCAYGSEKVGIDIERVRDVRLDIAKQFFSPQEYYVLSSLPPVHRLSYFYDLWTLKESYIKFNGKGMDIPLNKFRFQMERDEIVMYVGAKRSDLKLRQYQIGNEYKISVCSNAAAFSEILDIVKLSEVISWVCACE